MIRKAFLQEIGAVGRSDCRLRDRLRGAW